MSDKDYRKLSLAEKEARNRMHGRPRRCPVCEIGLQPGGILGHEPRCEGLPDLHIVERWIGHREALKIGVSWSTLRGWVRDGRVRVRISAEGGLKRYLLGDVELCILARRLAAKLRRDSKHHSKQLTKPGEADPSLDMGRPMDNETRAKLADFAESVGGWAAAGRKLDIPSDTLRRAANGESVRRGTVVLIDRMITEVTTR